MTEKSQSGSGTKERQEIAGRVCHRKHDQPMILMVRLVGKERGKNYKNNDWKQRKWGEETVERKHEITIRELKIAKIDVYESV